MNLQAARDTNLFHHRRRLRHRHRLRLRRRFRLVLVLVLVLLQMIRRLLRRVAEVTGGIFGVGVGALEADQRYEEYKVLERMRINRAAREVDEFYSMFSAPEPGEGITPTDIEMGYGDFANDEFPNLFRGTEEPMTDSMGRLLNDERFLINTDTEEGLAEMTDADFQAEMRRMVEEAETGGTAITPGDSEETQFQRASRNKDAEQAAQEEYEKRQKAREAEGDTFEGAPEFDDDGGGGDGGGDEAEYNKYRDAGRDYEQYQDLKDATEEYEEYQKYKAATEQYEDIAPYSYEPGQTPKQDVSDLADELAEEMGTPLPDDVPTSPNIMTEEEWNSLEPGLKGGGESGTIGEIGGGQVEMIGELGGEAVAMDEGIATAAKIAAAAKAAETGVSAGASVATGFARAAELAEAGEEAAVATTIITGLAGAQGAALAPVLAAGAEIAVLTAVTYGAEKLYNKTEGKVERPDSLDGAAHELTQTERDYFQQFTDKQVHDAQVERGANVDPAQLRRQPISPFAAKGSGVTPGSGPGGQKTPLSVARDRDLYIEMSDAEKKCGMITIIKPLPTRMKL